MPTKTLVCLANSRKPLGRCVAGKEIVNGAPGPWIRPVSARPLGELALTERWYGRPNAEVQVGHVFHIELLGPRQHAYQRENQVIDPQYHLGYASTASWDNIIRCLDQESGPLWANGPSTTYGTNDYISESTAPQFVDSLKLLEINDLQVQVSMEWPGSSNSRRAVRGIFVLNGHDYALKITDPVFEALYLAKPDGIYSVGKAVVCLSLSEPLNGRVFKLIASVIVKGTSVTV